VEGTDPGDADAVVGGVIGALDAPEHCYSAYRMSAAGCGWRAGPCR
jgi:hypothetical protein